MKEITLKINVRELQTLLQALGNLPYIQVQELIGKVQQQAVPQLQSPNGTAREAKDEPLKAGRESRKAEKVT